MSQEKVDKYKQEKANRKKTMKKEKAKHFVRRCVVGVFGLALIGWLGYSVYHVYDTNRPKQTAEIDYSAISDYQQSMTASDTEAE